MGWRYQIEAVLCAVLLLASTIVVGIRTLAAHFASLEFETELIEHQVAQPTLSSLNTTSRAKAPPIRKPRVSQSSSLEITSQVDEGSLWDQGPPYDLSK
jgi:hypothetical protein